MIDDLDNKKPGLELGHSQGGDSANGADEKVATRQRILEAALSLFSAKGLEGASVREIAELAGVNSALISYHFGGKEKLYFECLSYYALSKLESLKPIFTAPESAEDFKAKISLFLNQALLMMSASPEFVRMINREFSQESEVGKRLYLENFDPMFKIIRSFLKKAQENKIIRSDVKVDFMAVMIFALLGHPCHAEVPMRQALGMDIRDEKFVHTYSHAMIEIFVNGVLI